MIECSINLRQLGLHLCLFLYCTLYCAGSFAREVTVPDDYSTIQAAVDAANSDTDIDAIKIEVGTYTETLSISNALAPASNTFMFRGEETARTKLLSNSTTPFISLNNASNITIKNLTFISSGSTAITAIEISNNSTNITITNNVFQLDTDTANPSVAIEILDTTAPQILNNTFYLNDTGLFGDTSTATIQNNIFSNNTTAIDTGMTVAVIDYNCFFTNTDNGIEGTNAVVDQNPIFVNTAIDDFHLQQASPCIDTGTGTDSFDSSTADMGAYGDNQSDNLPYPVQNFSIPATTNALGVFSIDLTWTANLDYLVTHSDNSKVGQYEIHYDTDQTGDPYKGTKADQGISPIIINADPALNTSGKVNTTLTFSEGNLTAPAIDTAFPSNKTIDLEWSEVDGATDYEITYTTITGINVTVSVGNVTSHTLTELENNVEYSISVKAVANTLYYINVKAVNSTTNKNTSVFSTEQSISSGIERSTESTIVKVTPDQVIAFPNLPDEGCFIATAAYGVYSAEQVQALRNFRDEYLNNHWLGQQFVHWYYRQGPKAASFINEYPTLKPIVRLALYPLVVAARLLTQTTIAAKLFIILTFLFVVVSLYTLHTRQIINIHSKLYRFSKS